MFPGGWLVINAIRKVDRDKPALLEIDYHEHLWMEREIKSVANITRDDLAEFLPLAADIDIRPTIERYPSRRPTKHWRRSRESRFAGRRFR